MGKIILFRKRSRPKKYLPLLMTVGVVAATALLVYAYVEMAAKTSSTPSMAVHPKW